MNMNRIEYFLNSLIFRLILPDSILPYPITRDSERTLIERPMQIALLSLACSFSFTPFASATLLLFFFKTSQSRRDMTLQEIDD